MFGFIKKYIHLPLKSFSKKNLMKVDSREALNRLDRTSEKVIIDGFLGEDDAVCIAHLVKWYGHEGWFQDAFTRHDAIKPLLRTIQHQRDILVFSDHIFDIFVTILRNKNYDFVLETHILLFFHTHIDQIFREGLYKRLSESDLKTLVCESVDTFVLCEKYGCLTYDIVRAYVYHIKTHHIIDDKSTYFFNLPYTSLWVKQKFSELNDEDLLKFKNDMLHYFTYIFTMFYDDLDMEIHSRQLLRTSTTSLLIQNLFNCMSYQRTDTFWADGDKDLKNNMLKWVEIFLTVSRSNDHVVVKIGDVEVENIHGVVGLLKLLPLKCYMTKISDDVHERLLINNPDLHAVKVLGSVVDDSMPLYTFMRLVSLDMEDVNLIY